MMPLLYWNKEDVSIEIGTLAILNGPGVNVPSVRVTALSACKCMVKKSSERKQKKVPIHQDDRSLVFFSYAGK